MDNTNDKEYIQLDSSYDDMAKEIAMITKQHNKLQQKSKELSKELKIKLNQISLYFRNEFWEDYSYKKHIFMIDKNDLLFYNTKEMKIAQAKYDATQEDKDTFDEDFNSDTEDILDFSSTTKSDDNEYNNMVTFLKKELKEPIFEIKINPKQKITVNRLINRKEKLDKKFIYATQQMQYLQQDYGEAIEEIIDRLQEDKKYNFNYDTDEIMSVRDKKTLLWHLIYFKAENTQKIHDKILDKKGED